MHEFTAWHNAVIGEKAAAALNKNNFKACYFATRDEAVSHIMSLIPADATVGIGGSWTIKQLHIDNLVEERGHTVYNHNKPGLSPETVLDYRRKQLACDVFLTGTNALAADGKLVNTDAVGNRVAAMMFGPKKVIVVAGINKVADTLAEAEKKVKTNAAPINNKRFNKNNPCVKTGICMDCNSPERTCNLTTVIHRKPPFTDVHVVIIGEELGF